MKGWQCVWSTEALTAVVVRRVAAAGSHNPKPLEQFAPKKFPTCHRAGIRPLFESCRWGFHAHSSHDTPPAGMKWNYNRPSALFGFGTHQLYCGVGFFQPPEPPPAPPLPRRCGPTSGAGRKGGGLAVK